MFSYSLTNVGAANIPYTTDSHIDYELSYILSYQTMTTTNSEAKLWTATIENWSTIQDSTLLNLQKPTNLYNFMQDPWDKYNNSYDYYHKKFYATDNTFQLKYTYNVTLYSRGWDVPNNITLSVYNTTDDFYKFYTKSLPKCEANDPVLINLAQNLTKDYSGIVDKARSIYNYIIQNIKYEIQIDVLGAKQSYTLKKGDCSEFSSLMVALLRASGIPARKVLGVGIVEGSIDERTPYYKPRIGDVLSYNLSTIPGHAWMQYYIPDYGWISCDPTWGQAFYDSGSIEDAQVYFNRIDYGHLITTIGDWYEEDITPPLEFPGSTDTGTPEFLYIWFLHSDVPNKFSFDMTLKVVDKNIIGTDELEFVSFNILFLAGLVSVVLIILYWGLKPKYK